MKKFSTILTVSFTLLICSCRKFLKEDPKSQITPTNFFKNPNDAITAVNGVYIAALRNEVINIDYFWLNEMTADDAFYVGTPVVDRDGMNLLTYDPNNTFLRSVWANRYKAITRANEVLFYVNPSNTGVITNRVLAEARFLRAFCYFDLVRWFGDVPLIKGLASDDPYPKRAPMKDVYDFIVEDLKYAEVNLDDRYDYMNSNGGRATKAAAKTLLAKVYLTMAGAPLNLAGMYMEAENKCKEIINNKATYGLEFMANYKDMFPIAPNDGNKRINTEVIFYTRGNATLSAVGGSWSFHRIANWIRNSGFRASFDIITSSDTSITAVYNKNDLRRKSNLGKVRGAYPTTSSNPFTIVDIDATGTSATGTTITTTKYLDIINGTNGANDFPWLRYTDVMLMYSEALIEQNKSLNEARGFINMTRNRAGIGNSAAQTQLELRSELRAERRREFFFEGQRRFDLVRWGIFPQSVKESKARSFIYYRNTNIGDVSYMDNSAFLLFPIPNNEIITNPNMVQNPGY